MLTSQTGKFWKINFANSLMTTVTHSSLNILWKFKNEKGVLSLLHLALTSAPLRINKQIICLSKFMHAWWSAVSLLSLIFMSAPFSRSRLAIAIFLAATAKINGEYLPGYFLSTSAPFLIRNDTNICSFHCQRRKTTVNVGRD